MTIQELHDWAVENNVLDCDIIIRDSYGDHTSYIEPTIVTHKCANGSEYKEVEL